jgi:hypothetical protein
MMRQKEKTRSGGINFHKFDFIGFDQWILGKQFIFTNQFTNSSIQTIGNALQSQNGWKGFGILNL